MLTIDELNKRIERDLELKNRLDAERDTVRIRLYRYRKALEAFIEAEDCLDESDNNEYS